MAISDITKPMALDETLQGTNGKLDTHNGKMDSVITKLQGIIDALGVDTSVYKAAGNKTCAELVSTLLVASNLGNVYNITDNGTTTSDFVEGSGKTIHIGDNVAIVDVGTGGSNVYKFDLLAGMVDLTNYVQKSSTAGLLKNDGSVDTNTYATTSQVSGKADKVSSATNGNLAGLNGSGNLTDSGWNGAKDTTSISGNPISIPNLKANQLAVNPIITLEPIQAGSGTTSPSNIRAISGYDKIEVLSCGKNILDSDVLLQATGWSKDSNGIYSGNSVNLHNQFSNGFLIKLKSNTQYTVSLKFKGSAGSGTIAAIYFEYTDGTHTSAALTGISEMTYFSGTSASNKNLKYITIAWGVNTTIYISELQIEEGSTATTYSPYHKTTSISESLGQTVYAGTYNPRTGIFTATHAKKRLEGNDTWTGSNKGVNAQLAMSDMKSGDWFNDELTICDTLEKVSASVEGKTTIKIGANNTTVYLYNMALLDPTIESQTALNNYLTDHPIEFTYPLATPIEIQLTPHEISLLKDYAYVSTNGTNIALDYHNGELAALSDVAQLSETVENAVGYIGNEFDELRKNKRGSIVDLATYTTELNAYVFPSDGYVVVHGRSSTSGYMRLTILSSDNLITGLIQMNITAESQTESLYVRKGMKGYISGNSSSQGQFSFRPLV